MVPISCDTNGHKISIHCEKMGDSALPSTTRTWGKSFPPAPDETLVWRSCTQSPAQARIFHRHCLTQLFSAQSLCRDGQMVCRETALKICVWGSAIGIMAVGQDPHGTCFFWSVQDWNYRNSWGCWLKQQAGCLFDNVPSFNWNNPHIN